MSVTVKITGVKELDRKLSTMSQTLVKRAARTGTREVAKLSRDVAVTEAPEETGDLIRTVKVRAPRRSRRFRDFAVTTVVVDQKEELPYEVPLEMGTIERYTNTGAYRGRIDATEHSFLRRGLFAYPNRKRQMFVDAIRRWMKPCRVIRRFRSSSRRRWVRLSATIATIRGCS